MVVNLNIGSYNQNPYVQDTSGTSNTNNTAAQLPNEAIESGDLYGSAVNITLSPEAEIALADLAANTASYADESRDSYPVYPLYEPPPEEWDFVPDYDPNIDSPIDDGSPYDPGGGDGGEVGGPDDLTPPQPQLTGNGPNQNVGGRIVRRGGSLYLVLPKSIVSRNIDEIQNALSYAGYAQHTVNAATLANIGSKLALSASAKATLGAIMSGGWVLAANVAIDVYGDYLEQYEEFVEKQSATWEQWSHLTTVEDFEDLMQEYENYRKRY